MQNIALEGLLMVKFGVLNQDVGESYSSLVNRGSWITHHTTEKWNSMNASLLLIAIMTMLSDFCRATYS